MITMVTRQKSSRKHKKGIKNIAIPCYLNPVADIQRYMAELFKLSESIARFHEWYWGIILHVLYKHCYWKHRNWQEYNNYWCLSKKNMDAFLLEWSGGYAAFLGNLILFVSLFIYHSSLSHLLLVLLLPILFHFPSLHPTSIQFPLFCCFCCREYWC